ncbi:folate-binding protein YgfZ [Oceaniserpentilla sp. 4NH20-0058]|uniref:CAF17-like 4Fe-4S cluster assembly/insertion protein YgfZ n=1 Tax=Oceaniserpentilla sp. 4NH20-0058 TaxID=3127660 RepID=UPI003108D2A7
MSSFWSDIASFPSASSPLECMLHPIEDQTVLSVSGPDSHKFMQGQFTCNLTDITSSQYRNGACCNAKGRMVSSFQLHQQGQDQYLMALHASLAQITQEHLKKYMVFFKCKMMTTDYVLAGLSGPQSEQLLSSVLGACPHSDFEQSQIDGGFLVKLPHGAGFQLFLKAEQAKQTIEPLLSKCTLSNNKLWNQNLIHHGIGYITDKTSDEFIPQMINLNQNNGISFNKGCYTGQEIVARMQYLGKLKRHMYRLSIDPSSTVTAGDHAFIEGKNSPVGMVVNATITSEQQYALVVLEDKVLPEISSSKLYLGDNQGIAQELLSLPYDVIDAQPE